MDEIYSVEIIGNGIWVTKETYLDVEQKLREAQYLTRDEFMSKVVKFNSYSGSVHHILLHSVVGLAYSTREQRKKQSELVMAAQTEFITPYISDKNAQTS